MDTNEQMLARAKQIGFLPLFYHDDSGLCKEVVLALFEAGVQCIEFTNRGDKALENFKELVKLRDETKKDALISIGTIKSGNEAQQFIDAGADFLISHIFDKSVCEVASRNKVFWVPGCTTPTEIHVAQQAGCKLIKLFPGNVLGPGYVEAIRPLFNGIDFAITGGVETTEENIAAWFRAGASVVGLGSKLISKEILLNRDFEKLKSKTKEVIAIINKLKKAE